MSQRPRFLEDDEDERLARRTTRISWAILLLLLGACLLSLWGCASQSEQVGDATITAGSAAAGAVAAGPIGAGVAGGVAALWTALTGGVQATGPDGQPWPPLGFFARLGRFIDTWVWWCLLGLVVLWLLFPRTRQVMISLVAWMWRLPKGEVTPAEAVTDLVLAAPRAVGLVHSSIKAQDVGRKEAKRAASR